MLGIEIDDNTSIPGLAVASSHAVPLAAIIGTMSPALSHVEQSRNTLSFATSAREVMNSAQVNMFIWAESVNKHVYGRDVICDTHCYCWAWFICTLDRQYAE